MNAPYNRRVATFRRYFFAMASVALAIVVLELLGPTVNGAAAAQILLLVLIIDARFYGTGPAIVASLCAAAGFSRYFVTPSGFNVGDSSDWAALAAFIIMAVVVGELASSAERRAREAQAGRQEVARLYQELQAAFDRASEVEAARRSEQVKAALLDALTHNLRTPLTAIKASVTALIGVQARHAGPTLSREGQRDLLEVIDEESDRLNRFIEGLSAAGSDSPQPLNLRAVAVGDIVRMGLARAETLTRDYRVEVDVAEGLPPLSVDAPSIVEVLYILLDNASKYAPPGSTILVSGAMSDEQHVGLSVSDEGEGIPIGAREQVFEKFFRVPGRESHDPRRKGIGLGLPIARRLVEAQGGRIWIDSPSSGSGTLVQLTVPVSNSKAPAANLDAAVSATPAAVSLVN
jgi:two-component system sensor histidine kinase KdpD